MANEYWQKQQLISQLSNWWTKNGWNLKTLESKSTGQLLAIRNKAQSSGWSVTSKSNCKNQISFNF